jgi:chitinase
MRPRKNVLTALTLLSCLVALLAVPLASAAPTYEVKVTVVGSGSVSMSPAGGWYAKNNIVTLTAEPVFGWTFQKWSGALSGSANPTTLRVAGTTTVTATFGEGSGGGGGGGGGGGTTPTALPTKGLIVGYFAQWAIYQRNYFIRNVETSGAADAMNVMNYAFAAPDENLNCASLDTFADFNKAFDARESIDGVADVYSQPLKGNFNQILKLKSRHPNLRVLLSLGGWSQSQRFSEIAADATKRTRFVKSCIDTFMRGRVAGVFDGFDVDWEYPGSCGLTCNYQEADRVNFPALLSEFRLQLESLENEAVAAGRSRPEYLLTIAAPAGAAHYVPINIQAIHPHLDWINVMAYDFHGPWETTGPANHHAQLYRSPCDENPDTSDWGDKAIDAYLLAGVPASKLLLGVPFYGHGWRGVTAVDRGLCQAATGLARGTYERGTEDFKVIDAKGRPEFFDPETATHWSFNGSEFWSYDDVDSLGVKATYVNSFATPLRGIMFWELSGDTSDGRLVEALRSGLRPTP